MHSQGVFIIGFAVPTFAMPIRPEHRFFYPIDWLQLSAVIRFGRARGRCEGCGRPHRRMVYHLAMGAGGTRTPAGGVMDWAAGSGSQ